MEYWLYISVTSEQGKFCQYYFRFFSVELHAQSSSPCAQKAMLHGSLICKTFGTKQTLRSQHRLSSIEIKFILFIVSYWQMTIEHKVCRITQKTMVAGQINILDMGKRKGICYHSHMVHSFVNIDFFSFFVVCHFYNLLFTRSQLKKLKCFD